VIEDEAVAEGCFDGGEVEQHGSPGKVAETVGIERKAGANVPPLELSKQGARFGKNATRSTTRTAALKPTLFAAAATAALFAGTTARADEIFGGVLAHDVKTGITASGIEDGTDFQLGYRGERFGNSTRQWVPAPYIFASLNSAGDTNFAAAGVSWKFGRQVYVRPGIGLAIHDGPSRVVPGRDRIDFGSRILFEPEIALGLQINEQVSAEATLVHLSHAKLFGRQNPGMDSIGVRVNYRFR
jgi:hypothetical protein